MSPKQVGSFRLDAEILEALRAVQDREGIPVSEQVRRALLVWLKTKKQPIGRPKPKSS